MIIIHVMSVIVIIIEHLIFKIVVMNSDLFQMIIPIKIVIQEILIMTYMIIVMIGVHKLFFVLVVLMEHIYQILIKEYVVNQEIILMVQIVQQSKLLIVYNKQEMIVNNVIPNPNIKNQIIHVFRYYQIVLNLIQKIIFVLLVIHLLI